MQRFDLKEGQVGEVIVDLELFAMSILATKDDGGKTDIQHMATATKTDTEEEAERLAYEVAEQTWPKSDGWEHDVAVVKVPIKSRVKLQGVRR